MHGHTRGLVCMRHGVKSTCALLNEGHNFTKFLVSLSDEAVVWEPCSSHTCTLKHDKNIVGDHFKGVQVFYGVRSEVTSD